MSTATLWLVLALILAGLEMLSGTFYLLALSIGLVCGALAAWLGLAVALQTLIAAVISIIAAILLRRWKAIHIPAATANDNSLDIGQRVQVLTWLDDRHTRVQYRGSQWDAELAAGCDTGLTDYFIVAVRGSTIILHTTPPEKN